MSSDGNSTLMVGRVSHRRFSPQSHHLDYPLFMPCIDVDELDDLAKNVWGFGYRWWHWARFKRSDYVGSTGDIKQAVQNKVYALTGDKIEGTVKMVCHLRYLGLYFSPVNFYYLYDESGQWRYMLAEVSNTPWNERHYYAVNADAGIDHMNWQQQKAFHVSPFNPVDQRYRWKLKPLTNNLMVHLECHKPADNHAGEEEPLLSTSKVFDATLKLKAEPLNSKNLVWQLIKMPVLTVKVVIGIYWHAFKLWRKGVPLYTHPAKQK